MTEDYSLAGHYTAPARDTEGQPGAGDKTVEPGDTEDYRWDIVIERNSQTDRSNYQIDHRKIEPFANYLSLWRVTGYFG